MTRVHCITEMGMGVDVHGKDATKAAKRGVGCNKTRTTCAAGTDTHTFARRVGRLMPSFGSPRT